MTVQPIACHGAGHSTCLATAQRPARPHGTARQVRRRLRRALVLSLSVFAAMSGTTAQAGLTAFDDRSSFLAATLQTQTATFDGWIKDTGFHSSAVDVGGFTLSMTAGASDVYNFIDAPPAKSIATDINGSTHLMVFTDTGVDLTFSFDQPITAFGADFKGINDAFERTLLSAGGQFATVPGDPLNLQLTFFGVTSDTPFSSLTFHGVRNDIYGIDDVTFGTALRVPAVPEPGSMLMLSLGLAGVVAARRRAGRATQDQPHGA